MNSPQTSLDLLKSVGKNTQPTTENGEVVVDVDVMSSQELDALVDEYDIDVPEAWPTWKVEQKRAWLNAQDEEEEPALQHAEPHAPKPQSTTTQVEETATAEISPKKTKEKKPKPPTQAKEGEIILAGEDTLSDLVEGVENLNEKDAKHLAAQLVTEGDVTFIRLGGVLSLIQVNSWFHPHDSFKEYVEKEHGLNYRKASYWVSIYNCLSDAKIPWRKVQHIGWSKLKEIASVLTNDNLEEWIKIAETQNTLTLIETVKKSKAKPETHLDDKMKEAKTLTTKTFKLHADQRETIEQALKQIKEQTHTDYDAVALELICADYMSSQTIVQKLQSLGLEAALAQVEKAFPQANITVELDEAA